MVQFYSDEQWAELIFDPSPQKKYAVSDYGRIISFQYSLRDGKLLKGSTIQGYNCLKCRINGREKTYYVHKLVAQYFLPKQENEIYVIHFDYDKKNNKINNLKWVTKAEMFKHQQHNPNVLKARKKQALHKPLGGHKLTSTDVIRIKTKIWDPNRKTRLKLIAKQFNISEMQLYRIKSGENWSHIRIPNEPERTKNNRHSV